MKYRIEGNELIVNGLFSEKRYDFRELTKVSFVDNICIYVVIKAFGQRIQTLLLFARHGRALTGVSPEHTQVVGSV